MIVSSGIACGVLLGVIEGVGVLMQRMFAEGNRELAFGVWL